MSSFSHIFIDGYNVINAWTELKTLMEESMEDARHKLGDMLQNYVAYKGIKVTIVYDGHFVKGSVEKHETFGNIEVIFTKEGESADVFIERNVAENSKKRRIGVVTSDYLEQRITLQMGGYRVTPKEFLEEVKQVEKKIKEKTKINYTEHKNLLENNIDIKTLEKLEKIRRNL